MAASSHLKTHSQPQPHRSKRRKRHETTISVSSTHSLSPHVVSSDGSAWCCSVSSKAHHHQPTPSSASPPHHRRPSPPPPPEPDPAVAESSQSPSPAQVSPGCASPGAAMDASPAAAAAAASSPAPAAAFPAYHPSSYSKFNSALNAGLLNPMSPPPRSPTLFDMMTNEHDYHPRPALPQHPPPASRAAPVQDRQLLLQERIADILGSCSPGSQFNDPDSSDVRLTLSSKDGFSVSLNVHRHILVTHSRFFAAKLSDRWSRQQRSLPHLVEISDCDDVDVYIETLRLMYCKDIRRRLMKEDVSKVLGILKVSAAILFDAGVLSCLEYLEAAPWAEDEEEKVASLLSQLHLESSGAGEVLKRVSLEVAAPSADEANGNGGEEILVRLLQVVLEG